MLQMPTDHILSLLISERDKLTRAIDVLQGTSRGGRQGTSRGGRPRKNAMPATEATPTPNHKPTRRRWSVAMKLAAAERAKAVWVRRRKAQGNKG